MAWINWGSESQEQKSARLRFEEEQALYEQAVRASRSIAAQSGVGGSKKKDPTSNLYVEDGYVENYFE